MAPEAMSWGSPVAGKPHGGEYGEPPPPRRWGGGGWDQPPASTLPVQNVGCGPSNAHSPPTPDESTIGFFDSLEACPLSDQWRVRIDFTNAKAFEKRLDLVPQVEHGN